MLHIIIYHFYIVYYVKCFHYSYLVTLFLWALVYNVLSNQYKLMWCIKSEFKIVFKLKKAQQT